MDGSRWETVQRIFAAALGHQGEAREAFLREACGDDRDLREEVRSLLEADSDGHSLLDGGAAVAADELGLLEDLSHVGEQVGPWRLVERIGRGGMGAVYRARRADGEFEQEVALKLIKRGLDSEEILGRFRSERQILARLEHPNIARFLDGGLTDDGRPWFTLELVDGVPIDRYCEERHLSVEERLDLFTAVCRAVAHAQRNLVVHRDLKPSNILVTPDGTPKLLDFGIAKLLDDGESSSGTPAMTRTGHRVMTPGYAAPEQVRGEPVTTATDVYALGVVLYELLTGQRPYEPDDETPAGLERAICETNPPKPSTVVAGRPSGTRPGRLRKKLAGDLDNICLMALRKEPERRYGSAAQLLADLESYRAGRPVSARPDTLSYRVRMFVRRNRAAVTTAAAVTALVIALVTFYTGQLARERDRARLEAEKARSVSSFLTDLFEVADPSQSLGETITARELLDRGAAKIDDELADQPEVRATMMDAVGSVYLNLGLYAEADTLLGRALDIRRELHEGDDEDLAASLEHLGKLRRTEGDFDRALELLERARDMRVRLHGAQDVRVAEALYELAAVRAERGETAQAEEALRSSLAMWTKLRGEEDPGTLSAMADLALLLNEKGDRKAAEPVFRRTIELQRKVLGEHPELSTTLYNYSELLRQEDRLAEAEKVLAEALRIDRHVYEPDHPNIVYDLVSLGRINKERYHYDEAETLFREALESRVRTYGPEHPQVAYSLADVAGILHAEGRYAEAESLYVASLEMHRRLHGPDHPIVASRLRDLGRLARDRGDYAAAVAYHRQACELRERLYGEDSPQLAETRMYLARALADAGRLDEALDLQRKALETTRSTRGEGSRETLFQMQGMAVLLGRAGATGESEALFRETLRRRSEAYGDDHPTAAQARADYGRMLVAAGRPDEGKALLERARDELLAVLPAENPRVLSVEKDLAAIPSSTPE